MIDISLTEKSTDLRDEVGDGGDQGRPDYLRIDSLVRVRNEVPHGLDRPGRNFRVVDHQLLGQPSGGFTQSGDNCLTRELKLPVVVVGRLAASHQLCRQPAEFDQVTESSFGA